MAKKKTFKKVKSQLANLNPARPKHKSTAPNKTAAARPAKQTGKSAAEQQPQHFPIVGIGASAGGLEAFTQLLKALPADTGMGFVLVQHMDPKHESVLAGLLQKSTQMPVCEAEEGMAVQPNRVYICPPNDLMTISSGALSLTTRGPRSFKDFPIDQFFISLADDLKNRAIGVVLSGTASDGTRGLLGIKAEGGITFAQDTVSAQFPSMPASAIASGCVDFTLTPAEIAVELSQINGHPYLQRPRSPEPAQEAEKPEEGVAKIVRLLKTGTGVDFGLYKPAMVGRRIARRMALHKTQTVDQYFALLRKNRVELNALQEDIFIHVTSFFRDPESLQALRKRVLGSLLPGDMSSRNIRIWVPGCSTGEELYSIGILLFEQLGERCTEANIQMFGTDISERAVQRARTGIYPSSSMVDVSPERQRRFFNHVDGNYQVTKSLRDVCVFARHDLSRDPPFSRIDLISCRNVLIYMGATLQKKIIESFHYALRPGGHLLLGKAESLSAYSSLFAVEDNKHKILARRPLGSPLHVHLGPAGRTVAEPPAAGTLQPGASTDLRREAERLLLDQYAPAAIVVDPNLQIVHFQGNTGLFLNPASGEPSFHLLRMIRPELLVDVRTAIFQAKKERGPVRKEGVRFRRNGDIGWVDIHVAPIQDRQGREFDYLVVFRESSLKGQPSTSKESAATKKDLTKNDLVRKERELNSLREQLQAMVHDHEAADEEMRSMNEEILSSNEELQSTNEELETAKEELESSNEELTTLNDELQKRNFELSQTSDDLSNLLTAVNIPVVILDNEMKIRRLTPAAGQMLNIISTDLGRPLSDIVPRLIAVNWRDLINEVTQKGSALEREVQDREGHWYSLRVRPYTSGTERIDGVMITLFDIDALKRSAEAISVARKRSEELEAQLELIGEGVGVGVFEIDVKTGETSGSRRWRTLYGIDVDGPVSRADWLARVHPDDHAGILNDLGQLLGHTRSTNREYRVLWPDGAIHWLNRRAELVRDENGQPSKIRGVSIDITERKQIEQEKQVGAFKLAAAQGAERQRIARELHDGLIQDLAALAVDLGKRASDTVASSDDRKSEYKALQVRVVEAATAARHIAYELHPSELDDLGLENALKQYCQEFGRQQGLTIEYSSRAVPQKLKREITSAIYKVAQEGLWNVAKHSKAKKAKISLEGDDNVVRLRVEDSGAGFNMLKLNQPDGIGLASMRERTELIRGKFTITSAPRKGTQITVEVPALEE